MRQTTIIDIVDALHSGDPAKITATSLSRVWQHVNDLGTQSFGVLTSQRSGRSPAQNKAAFKQLQQDLRSLGLGFFKLAGHWVECLDPNVDYDHCPKDQLRDVAEPSLFVPQLTLKDAHRLGKKYDQDAVIYGGPDASGKIVLVFRDGSKQVIGNKFSPRAVGQGFSELGKQKGRKFSFVAYVSDSPMEAQSASVYERATYGVSKYSIVTGVRS